MENGNDFDKRAQIINELLQGLESAKQLQNQFTNKNTCSSLLIDDHQALSLLVEKMMSSFDKTISIAKQITTTTTTNNNNQLESSPHSLAVSSPMSENSQPDHHRATKRRKMMPRWTKTVQVGPSKSVSGLEGPLDDGFSWRKYGQKGILGAKFPRGYYRCTHRHSKGCAATKQVQQSDEDPSIYQVMYKGDHTCYSGLRNEQAQTKPTSAHKPKTELPPPPSPNQHFPISQQIIQEVFVGLGPEGNLETEPNVLDNKAQLFRCFSFNSGLLEAEPIIDNYILSCSPDFASPTTSGSNYFPASPYRITGTCVGLNVQTSESDWNDSNSGQNSVTNSPTTDDFFVFPLEQWPDLDPTFF